MSWLSDIVRTTTGGRGVGETVGGTIGGFLGGTSGAVTGARIGGGITEYIDRGDSSEGQATARSVNQNLPQESGASGNMQINPYMNGPGGMPQQGFIGPALTAFGRGALQQGSRLVSPGGLGGAVGYGLAGAGVSLVMDAFGNSRRMIITRKMQREVKELFAYAQGDMNAVAQIYSQFKGMNYSAENILQIMLKKFRNDGPYVTKAAVRKTRSTVRKMHRLNQLYADITPKARPAARRRAASTTRITQVK
tara:strand:+ start:814 stop:1563 length:750 start_codon:yes stop_codon:yes gene_type:complete